jgi:hypothetical protein
VTRSRPALALAFAWAALSYAQNPSNPRWKGLDFLLGNWTGAGSGQPGAGSGKFSFQPDLDRHVIVRRSFNQLASGPRHEDLLVIYADAPDGDLRGMYFDSEGHVIRYKVTTPAEGRAIFESDGAGPAYRLSYWMEGKVLKGKFDVGGRTYLEWGSEKESAK